ncbi:Capsule polysaccharide export inner-membrane protein ctrB [Roseomonas mucosa]|mgnify:CR=1 FL=1|uniref:Capsule biosynthesis protein n=2 Tax=Roseomonadaceae TaxID=3385906 RepID=A0A1S8D6Z1_9PROT|nr:capsule biosynthesis protein [Roseomonas sp. FDAARGOS_362]MDT8265827.1 capsule biosynthesis protein [Roseomonas sp. DSM 102946]ONH83288.1 capsule biosynthesis protein [Roseomonas mucosa]GAV35384.1 Chain length determinant protein [Roseomonas sp. TAS13]QDD92961.1 Capsule polysaccharide export inner-membrane protein ctrB [Roseomonas mucosa]
MKLSPPISPFDATGGLEGSNVLPPLPRRRGRLQALLHRYRMILLVIGLPMLIASTYFLLVATPQYQSEARFLVRTRSGGPTASSALGSLLTSAGFTSSNEDALAIVDFIKSRDALDGVQRTLNLVEIWRRPEADLVARLWDSDPPAERLLKYYKRMVNVSHDSSSGTVTLSVRAFRTEDAQAVAEALLTLSEGLVNKLGDRARENTLNVARAEVTRAEQRVIAAREAVTDFRVRERLVDPASEAKASLEIVAKLEATLTQARAELIEKTAYLRPGNPELRNVQNRIDALERQIAIERARITADGRQALPQQLAGYERLLLEREFADKQLASATASLETARVDAQRQALFLARVVEPNMAQEAEYPKAGFILGSLFAILCVLYAMGWLVVAGVREHAS